MYVLSIPLHTIRSHSVVLRLLHVDFLIRVCVLWQSMELGRGDETYTFLYLTIRATFNPESVFYFARERRVLMSRESVVKYFTPKLFHETKPNRIYFFAVDKHTNDIICAFFSSILFSIFMLRLTLSTCFAWTNFASILILICLMWDLDVLTLSSLQCNDVKLYYYRENLSASREIDRYQKQK